MAKKDDIIQRILGSPALKDMDPLEILAAFEKLIKVLRTIDATDQEMFYIIDKKKSILKWSIDEIQKNIGDMIRFGYPKIAIRRMLKDAPDVASFPIKKFEDSLIVFSAFGLTKEEFLRVTKDNTKLLDYTLDDLLDKRRDIMSLGFSEDDFKTMLINDSRFLKVTIPTIVAHMDNFRSFDYTEEEIRKIMTTVPGITSRSVDTIHERVEVIQSLGIRHVYVDTPNRLRQSAHLTRAKAAYLINNDVFPKSPTGINYLFASSKDFKAIFGVDHKGVEALYDLQKELREKRLQMGIVDEDNP